MIFQLNGTAEKSVIPAFLFSEEIKIGSKYNIA